MVPVDNFLWNLHSRPRALGSMKRSRSRPVVIRTLQGVTVLVWVALLVRLSSRLSHTHEEMMSAQRLPSFALFSSGSADPAAAGDAGAPVDDHDDGAHAGRRAAGHSALMPQPRLDVPARRCSLRDLRH